MVIGVKELQIPIIQGGMGVGVSLSSLAGAVAKCGGMGVISSVNAGYDREEFRKNPVETNLNALKDHIKKAKEIAQGNGMVAVNIMTAVSHYEETVRAAIEAGADAIISGAGLPLKLAELVKGTKTLFAPIVSSGKAAALLCKNYSRKQQVVPDFLVVEGHGAGGHLGFSKEELKDETYQSNTEILRDVLDAIAPFEAEYEKKIPVFVGGGVFDRSDVQEVIANGAAGVQIGTRFIATHECDAHPRFKQAILEAKEEDIRIVSSPVGMPARALYTPLIQKLEQGEKYLAKVCNNCLTACPKGDKVLFCISRALVEAVKGNYEEGLFFCGENAHRIDKIVSVQELMEELRP